MTVIRRAELADLPAIVAIYNDVIETSTAIYRDAPTTVAERSAWFEAQRAGGFPVLVAESSSAPGEVVGFATFGPWRGAFPGYRHTVEHSVHIRADQRGRGHGSALVAALFDEARARAVHVMIGAIDADNGASLAMHAALGFSEAGRFHQVGRKFDRWLDLVFVQRRLD